MSMTKVDKQLDLRGIYHGLTPPPPPLSMLAQHPTTTDTFFVFVFCFTQVKVNPRMGTNPSVQRTGDPLT